MNTSYLDEWLERAKSGKLSERELDTVVRELQKPDPDADRYKLLHILGRAGNLSQRGLVEQFLEYGEEPMVARLALKILCDYWSDAARYIPEVLRFLKGVAWDEENDVQQIAISIAGEYLRANSEPDFLWELIRIFEDTEKEQTIREDAYIALARAMGHDWNQIPSSARHFDLKTQIDPAILDKAKKRLGEEEKQNQNF